MSEKLSFFEDWKKRYIDGYATYTHLERLRDVGRLTEEEFREIVIAKRLKENYSKK